MTPKLLSLAAAAAIAVGTTAAVPAAATPGAPAAAKFGAPQSGAATQAVPVRHYYRNGPYCRRQYRLGFVLGDRGARVFFGRHCHPRWRGRHWRGRHWDRGYRRYHRGHRWRHRRGYRNYQNQR